MDGSLGYLQNHIWSNVLAAASLFGDLITFIFGHCVLLSITVTTPISFLSFSDSFLLLISRTQCSLYVFYPRVKSIASPFLVSSHTFLMWFCTIGVFHIFTISFMSLFITVYPKCCCIVPNVVFMPRCCKVSWYHAMSSSLRIIGK